jgi:hypothetical protein
MVHPVEDGVCPGRKVGATLCDPGENVKELFPEFAHDKHLVRCVPVQEKTLAEQ